MKIISETFQSRFQAVPLIVHSPGRVNLIGEHTDYNNGFVLPAAIDRAIVLAIAPNGSNKIRLHAVDMQFGNFETELTGTYERTEVHWVNYILGVVSELAKSGKHIGGFDCVFGGDIPIGAGLSSSAALEGGVIFGLSKLFDLKISRMQMALIGQKAENRFVGMQCGVMDQFSNIFGKEDHVMKLDCRSLEYEYFPFKREDISILLCDTAVRRELTGSEYNVRRSQCDEGVQQLRVFSSSILSLRDVSLALLEKHRMDLKPVVYNRCRFVVEENQRVLEACTDLLNADLASFGKKMYQSHYGLRDQYEVSCKELDILVNATEKLDGVLGSRMMGGGFGGCTINLVIRGHENKVVDALSNAYKEKAGRDLQTHIAKIGKGTHANPK
ncbi:MAG: galactokinase [Balneolales bacterium]